MVRSSRRQHTGRSGSGSAGGAANGVVVSMVGRNAARLAASSRRGSDRSMWMDRWVRDASGAALGVTVAVVCDPDTNRSVWLAVYTGVPAATVVVVPVCGSSLLGDDIVVDVDRDDVLAAPTIELDVTLDPTQDRILSDHFRRHAYVAAHPTGRSDQ